MTTTVLHISTILSCNFRLNSLRNIIKSLAKINFQRDNSGEGSSSHLENFNLVPELQKKKRGEGRSEKKGKEGGGDGEGERMRIHNKI